MAVIAVIHVLLVHVICLLVVCSPHPLFATRVDVVESQMPIPPLYKGLSGAFTALTARLTLFILGFYWIPVNIITRKRGSVLKLSPSDHELIHVSISVALRKTRLRNRGAPVQAISSCPTGPHG